MSEFETTNFPTCDNINQFYGVELLLRRIYELLAKQDAVDGMMLLKAADGPLDIDFYGFVVREDTVLGALSIKGVTVLDDYNIESETLLVTDPAIMAPSNKVFDYIDIDSGSVWLLLQEPFI